MTLRNRCVNCDHIIEAPETMRGKAMACPKCEATNVLLSAEDARERDVEAAAASQRERRKFLKELAKREQAGQGGAILQASLAKQDLALHAARRLKDISVYLLFFSYILLMVTIGLAVTVVVGNELATPWKIGGAVSALFVGLTVFLIFKSLSDTVRALADLTDLGRDIDERLARIEASQHIVRPRPMAAEGPAPGNVLSQAG